MRARTIRVWSRIHTWTSLVCTVFLLLLCLTGLPLLFHHEINHLLGHGVEPPAMPAGTPRADLDRMAAAAAARRPGEVVQYVIWDPEEPDSLYFSMAPTVASPPTEIRGVVVDARTALVLDEPRDQEGFVWLMLRLHTDLFAGLPGKLFMGAMGLLFVLAIVSGVVLYAPFMRRLDFGTVRRDRSRRVRWLDLHNLIGVATLCWALVVGATGVINTWADLIIRLWQRDELAEMVAPYRGLPPLERPGSLERAVAAAQAAAPGMKPAFVAFPGTAFSSGHHHAVFLRGATPLTSRLLTPALVDAQTGRLTEMRSLPWYGVMLFVSQPLHFGDYGGTPLRVIWALLDVATIVVLGSGLYLWVARRRRPMGMAGGGGQGEPPRGARQPEAGAVEDREAGRV
ncbi:PepSY domain-containing protein [Roseomonas sp. NAR14]|uniref:PepSY domain-containing protein n=1 Tax=Roseomonas acroporae TaxID=2937791 RepID=A0A9X2BUM3_9PROT|nr:PepSY-associated TM helix domain-containing protein [Roseomonas acroporae]MCK8783164.1 PepSY domain-containing protein [Roseomonas acroporae]